jgi:hypothetical protein
MSDQTQNASGSFEEVAYRVFHELAHVENVVFTREGAAAGKGQLADREYILTALSDCVHALKGGIYSKKIDLITPPARK